MKPRASFQLFCGVLTLGLAAGATPARAADTNAPSADVASPKSLFVIPTSPKEGCDPFFPDSTRPYEEALALNSHHRGGILSLALKGLSGTPDQRLAIINNHTFAVGEEGDVITTTGRVRLRCVEIREKSVVIEVDGQRQELILHGQP